MADCIFCRIVRGEIPCDKLYEDENVLAFRDIDPKAPQHVLIIPKEHYANVLCVEDDAMIGHLFHAARHLARELGIDKSGFRLVINTGRDAGQGVEHLHMHLLGARELGWPPG